MFHKRDEEAKTEEELEKQVSEYVSLLEKDAKEIGAYLTERGHGDIAEKFVAHKIEGRLLPFLTTDALIRMGVNVVGDQLNIIQEVERIRLMSRAIKSNKPIWSGT
mmetsp:Transcript_8616/g.16926  ORF Transcript_8616/g.16926 Transcript_8616/m.16926 type:complete len:106 (-) Transcript_8616:10-327(-)